MSVFCIGGLGGSGTRLVTKLLQDHNVSIGNSLNSSLDNLIFTLLFRRPSWFKEFPSNSIILEAIEIYTRTMCDTAEEFNSSSDKAYIASLIESGDTTIFNQNEWYAHIETHLEENYNNPNTSELWGWKEPNTHVFLPHLNMHNDKLKYVHVIRDGVYMMNSKNQNQLLMWAKYFNVERTSELVNSTDALNYWIAANLKTITYGQKNLSDRFYLLDYDQFCAQPETESLKLLSFLQIPVRAEIIATLANSVSYKKIDKEQRKVIFENWPTDIIENYHQLLSLTTER